MFWDSWTGNRRKSSANVSTNTDISSGIRSHVRSWPERESKPRPQVSRAAQDHANLKPELLSLVSGNYTKGLVTGIDILKYDRSLKSLPSIVLLTVPLQSKLCFMSNYNSFSVMCIYICLIYVYMFLPFRNYF
jgi:hypothetical protein